MMKFEAGDYAAVGDVLGVIEYYRNDRGAEGAAWHGAFEAAQARIGGFFDTYAPEVPQRLRENGIYVGALALAYNEMTFGADEHSPKMYSGAFEDGVPATYHNAGHSWRFVEDEFRYAVRKNQQAPGTYGLEDFASFPVIGGNHDGILGGGRGVDERRASLLAAVMHATYGNGKAVQLATGLIVPVGGTAWDEKTKRQAIDLAKGHGHRQIAAGVADLLPLWDERGPYTASLLLPEDMGRRMNNRLLQREAAAAGFNLAGKGVDELTQFVDARKRAFHDPVLRFYEGTVKLLQTFKPADPALDTLFPGRPANTEYFEALTAAYRNHEIGSFELLEDTRARTAAQLLTSASVQAG